MKSRALFGFMLILLLAGVLIFQSNIHLVTASSSVHNVDTGEEFATIQEAIDDPDTLDGHTILVDADKYYEHVTVHKSLTLTGENQTTTIVDGSGTGVVVNVTAPGVSISGFTITGSGASTTPIIEAGLKVRSNNNRISNCSVSSNLGSGIVIIDADHNSVENCTVSSNGVSGIKISYSFNNKLADCKVSSNFYEGVWLHGGFPANFNNSIVNCEFSENRMGIRLSSCRNNTFTQCNISFNLYGIRVGDEGNLFFHNNLISNSIYQVDASDSLSTWDIGYPSGGNYWSDYLERYPDAEEQDGSGIWNTPYVIDAENQDNYPLMYPWGATPPADTTPPAISILSPENKTYSAEDLPLTFTVDESTSWISYSLDGQANVTIAGNTTLSGLPDGSHSLVIHANDTAENTGVSEPVYFMIEAHDAEPFPTLIVLVLATIAIAAVAVFVYFMKFRK